MANTIARTIIQDGERNAIVNFTLIGDGSGEETAALVFDYSAMTPLPGRYSVRRVTAETAGCSGRLSFDATTDVPFMSLGADAPTLYKGEKTGGLPYSKFAASGSNGDIVLATTGLGAGDSISIELRIVKGSL